MPLRIRRQAAHAHFFGAWKALLLINRQTRHLDRDEIQRRCFINKAGIHQMLFLQSQQIVILKDNSFEIFRFLPRLAL
jgi:hypothetical protein